MKKFIIVGVAAVLIIVGAAVFGNNNKTSAPSTSSSQGTAETTKKIAVNAVIYDVRTPEEYAVNRAKGAINLPLEMMQSGTMPTDAKDTPIYVYCRSGNRSAQATVLLKKAGFTNVTDMGGLDDAVATYGLDAVTGP